MSRPPQLWVHQNLPIASQTQEEGQRRSDSRTTYVYAGSPIGARIRDQTEGPEIPTYIRKKKNPERPPPPETRPPTTPYRPNAAPSSKRRLLGAEKLFTPSDQRRLPTSSLPWPVDVWPGQADGGGCAAAIVGWCLFRLRFTRGWVCVGIDFRSVTQGHDMVGTSGLHVLMSHITRPWVPG
eukprot:1348888-Amorphochlora_amoeboformis.AAC.1